ncbi:kinesin-like protein kif7 [Genypterus blacodes]|uniref:kinesin-like protein kif7 n=1 Tax=Genypterus blacodes TaxID=154954 RepID=UPI003F7691EE
MDEGLAGRQRQYEGWIHNLSKELSYYKATNQELSHKLRELIGPFSQNKAVVSDVRPSSVCSPDAPAGGRVSVQPKCLRSREEMRELVNTPLPSTWRRSSLPTEEPAAMEELWLHAAAAAAEVPVHRVVQAGGGPWSGPPSLPSVKSRRDSRRSSLNVGAQSSNNAMIDVRRNPV